MNSNENEIKVEAFKLQKRELKYPGRVIDLFQDTVVLPDGKVGVWDVIDHKGAAAVIPVMDDGRILMVCQYRHAIGRVTVEVPAGGLNSREEPTAVAAARELEEETGYRSDDLKFLISIHTVAAYSNEKIDIYVARNLIPSHQNLDEDEYICVKAYTLDELCNMIHSGSIMDSKTISAVMTYKDSLSR